MRALIVDDDELSLEILQTILQEMGYEVERAANGKQAITRRCSRRAAGYQNKVLVADDDLKVRGKTLSTRGHRSSDNQSQHD